MNRFKLYLLAFCVFFYLSTHEENNAQNIKIYPTYSIDIKKDINNIGMLNLSSLGKDISYIPLETKTECLIQKINKILFSDSYIFISDFKRLLQFDKTGKFIRQIGHEGSGPGEYINVGDFCIDEQNKEIYLIFSSASKLMVFGFDGVFKNTNNLTFRPAQIILKDKSNLMFHLWNVPGKRDPSWIVTNRKGLAVLSLQNNLTRISQPGFLVNHSPLYKFANNPYFMEFGIDTLYYFDGTQKMLHSVFSFGDLKMVADPVITLSMIKDVSKSLEGKLWTCSIIENEELMFIEIALGIKDTRMHAIYDKKANNVTFLKDNAFNNDLGGGVGFWPKQIVDDKILVDYADAFVLLKKVIPTNLRNRISETSNPVLIILQK